MEEDPRVRVSLDGVSTPRTAPYVAGGCPLRLRVTVAVAASAALVWLLFVWDVGLADLLVFLRAARAVSSGITPYAAPGSPMLWSGPRVRLPVSRGVAVPPARRAAGRPRVGPVLRARGRCRGDRRCAWSPDRSRPRCPTSSPSRPEPAVRALQLGTLNPLLLLGLAVAWRFRRHAVVVVAVLVAVVVAKLFLLPMLPWPGAARPLAAGRGGRRALAGAVALGCVLAHYDLAATFVRMLSTLSAHEAVHSSSVAARLQRLGASGRRRAGRDPRPRRRGRDGRPLAGGRGPAARRRRSAPA